MALYSLKHKEKTNSKALIITQQHKYLSKKPSPQVCHQIFLSTSQHICNFLSATSISREYAGAACFCSSMTYTACTKSVMNIFIWDIRSCLVGSSVSHWNLEIDIKMVVLKLRFAAKPPGHSGYLSLYLAVSHTCTHRDVYDSRKCMQ